MFCFFLQNSKTALPGVMIRKKERKKSWDPHVFEMLQAQDLLCYLYIFVIKAVIRLKGGPCRESMHEKSVSHTRIQDFFLGGGRGRAA